jgi:hypothetical protein
MLEVFCYCRCPFFSYFFVRSSLDCQERHQSEAAGGTWRLFSPPHPGIYSFQLIFVLFYVFFLQTMLRIAALPRDGFVWEDQYVVSQIPPHLVASEFEAKSFAVDNQYHPDAVALHKPYNLIPKHLIVRALHHIPGTDF